MFISPKSLLTGLIVFTVIAGIIHFLDPALLAGVIFCIFLASSTIAAFYLNKKQGKTLVYIFLSVFVLYIAIVLFLYYTNFQPFSGGDGDYQKYDYNARVIAESLKSGDFSLEDKISYTNKPILDWDNYFPLVIALIYIFVMPSMLLGQLFNAWLVALCVVAVYLLVLEIGGSKKGAVFSSVVTAFYPSLAFYGSLLLKDALVFFLAMFGLLFAVKAVKNFTWRNFIILYVLLACLTHFRFYVGYVLAISFALSWFLFCKMQWRKKVVWSIFIFLLFGFLPIFAGQDIFAYRIVSSYFNQQTISMYREVAYFHEPPASALAPSTPASALAPSTPASALAPSTPASALAPQENSDTALNQKEPESLPKVMNPGTSFLLKIDFATPLSFLFSYGKSFAITFLGPFFWQFKYPRHYLALLETIPWYFLLFFIGKGLFLNIRQKYKNFLPLLLFSFILLGILSLYVANSGALARIRIPAFIVLFCISSFGFAENGKIYKFLEKTIAFLKENSVRLLQWIRNLKLSYKACLGIYFIILFLAVFFDKFLAIGVLIVTLLSALTILIAQKSGIRAKKFYILFLIAILIHLFAVVFIYYVNFYPFGGGAGDGSKYHQVALELSERFRQGDFSIQGFDKIYPDLYVPHFYPVILAILYALTVPSVVIGVCFNVWFVALSIAFLYLIVKEIGGSNNNAFLVGLIASIYPSYLYFGSLLIRDAILVCFTMFALLFVIKLVKNFSWRKLLILSLAIGVILHLRFYIGLTLLLTLIVSSFFMNLNNKEKINPVRKKIFSNGVKFWLCILLILAFFPQIFSGQGFFGAGFFQILSNNKNIQNVGNQVFLQTGSVVVEKVGFDKPIKFMGNIVSSFFFISLGPFPWHIKYSRQLFALLEAVPWYFLAVLVVASVTVYLRTKNYKLVLPLLVFSFATLLVLSAFIDNYGTYMRIRIPVFLALMALLDFSLIKSKFKLNLNLNVLSFFKNKPR